MPGRASSQAPARHERPRERARPGRLPRHSSAPSRLSRPDGAFYAFFAVEGVADSLAFAKEVVARTGVGLAPGRAFGPEGEGWLRLCFAAQEKTLVEALDRLAAVLD